MFAPFQSLLEAHDQVASKSYDALPSEVTKDMLTGNSLPAEAMRMIGIQKKSGEPLVSASLMPMGAGS